MDRSIRINALLLAALAVMADQASKAWAVATLAQEGAQRMLPGPIDLTLSFNESNAFGLTPVIGQATRWFLTSANFAVAAVLLYVILTKPLRPLTVFGLALIMAGAVGNGLDRLFIGAVVDFIDATEIGFNWIFNAADATLDVGIGLLLLSTLRKGSGAGARQSGP